MSYPDVDGYEVYTLHRDGVEVWRWDDRDRCGPYSGPPCGGCGACVALQLEHAGEDVRVSMGLKARRAGLCARDERQSQTYDEAKEARTLNYFRNVYGWKPVDCAACSGAGTHEWRGTRRIGCLTCRATGKSHAVRGPKAMPAGLDDAAAWAWIYADGRREGAPVTGGVE